jgi:hypothetical protein
MSKSNSDYTTVILVTRSSKQDYTWIYLDNFLCEHFFKAEQFIRKLEQLFQVHEKIVPTFKKIVPKKIYPNIVKCGLISKILL